MFINLSPSTFTSIKSDKAPMSIYNKVFLVAIVLSIGATLGTLQAQVYPGDANNNGVVDHYDVLYVGYAYGSIGPVRLNPSTIFSPQSVLLDWPQSFPGGDNYAYADANGNGLVEWGDLLAINQNYNNQLDSIDDIEAEIGISGIDPSLDIQTLGGSLQVTENYELNLPIVLGQAPNEPVSFNGLAFSIVHNSNLIKDVSISFTEGWPSADGQAFSMQRDNPGVAHQLDAALTRFGSDPVTGAGSIGMLRIVIEDDLIGLLPADRDSMEVIVEIKDILMLNGNFENMPIIPDSLILMVYRPGLINATPPGTPQSGEEVSVFPNPTNGVLFIESKHFINRWEIYSAQGVLLAEYANPRQQYACQLQLEQWPAGIYYLRLFTESGMTLKKVIIQ